MNDFDRRLQDALKGATSDYRPADPHEAKQRFMTRFRRRRIAFYSGSVALAGAAVAIAFVAVPGLLRESAVGTLPPATSLAPQELGAIEVGGEPTDVAFGGGVVWVSNPGLDQIQRIGPLSNEVGRTYQVAGASDGIAIGLGAAWVSDTSTGMVRRIPIASNDIDEIQVGAPGILLDVAPGAGAVWVVAEGEGLFRIDADTYEVTPVDTGIDDPTDVAAGQGSVVVAGARALVRIDPTSLQPVTMDVLEPSTNRDLQMSEGAVWVADGDRGEVTRYDLDTSRHSDPVFVGGDFAAIASGEGAIWIVSGNDGEVGNLTRLDAESGEVSGTPVGIDGHPVDVTTGAGSVWVISTEEAVVRRIDPNAMPE